MIDENGHDLAGGGKPRPYNIVKILIRWERGLPPPERFPQQSRK
jgi:hypothetical protein